MAVPQHAQEISPELVSWRMGIVAMAPTALTINGNPARVSGYLNRFATVTDSVTCLSAEWSWETVEHVVNNSFGAFKA